MPLARKSLIKIAPSEESLWFVNEPMSAIEQAILRKQEIALGVMKRYLVRVVVLLRRGSAFPILRLQLPLIGGYGGRFHLRHCADACDSYVTVEAYRCGMLSSFHHRFPVAFASYNRPIYALHF